MNRKVGCAGVYYDWNFGPCYSAKAVSTGLYKCPCLRAAGARTCNNSNKVPVFGTSRYGKPMILVGSHKFWACGHSARLGKRWYCSWKKCRAVLFTKDDVIVKTNGEHNHG
ncbi:unnamed protein product [Chrysodeixis includens]|uniref:FLYWCH-type domain-containing protein n=1 Tax=Chrysodeixis includens TaxID=689277 RepID=A0A9N8Q0F7_CHRIL|nr:unnamed protein product [Chrysodeixis includens]